MGDLIGFPPSKGEVLAKKHLEPVKRNKKAMHEAYKKRIDEMKKAYEILSKLFHSDTTIEMRCSSEMRCTKNNCEIGEIILCAEAYSVKTDDMPLFLQAIKLADKLSICANVSHEFEVETVLILSFNSITT